MNDGAASAAPEDAARQARNSWLRALEQQALIDASPALMLADVIDELAERQGDRPALLTAESELSYSGLARRMNAVSRWALSRRLRRGDVACLFMANCPDYLAIWLGLSHLGIVVALVNTSLSGDALAHSLRIVSPAIAISDKALAPLAAAAAPEIPLVEADEAMFAYRGDRLAAHEGSRPTLGDRALFIYTSGTTGLPKAANVSHRRVMQWSRWFAGMTGAEPDDRMYHCLPMYHSVGGVVATGSMLVAGGSIYLRPRFSTTAFWREVVEQRCTLFQYIGELCRYLLNAPPDSRAEGHRLRLCVGNGLQRDVWTSFQRRFAIPRIIEFYAATEGNVSLYNCEGRPGAIGKIPPFLAHRFPIALVRVDPDTGEPSRGADGLCEMCDPDEPGEAIGRIAEQSRFEGYADPRATERKILRDVAARGDAWFRTGDLMSKGRDGFYVFVDRLGDTFRWKGENVSTTEVAAVLHRVPGIAEAVVYGVRVAGAEGRAGMAALAVTEAFDLAALPSALGAALPEYARPLFVRVCESLETTGTFKPLKSRLQREGSDPGVTTDPIYAFDKSAGVYRRLPTPAA